ncbi:acetolactate synthase-1/2/3 large subunit [Selenomonas ruminantium]|uniref:Acetolactate synthase-1/2/3 large subunit n=2 Tax=Selenomonas ruminantium TaxID=971 RepID=A0A1I0YF49_SELRU|nr:acetolactate synthase-1/2/3 large subunit [Selenomonas ruminantium]
MKLSDYVFDYLKKMSVTTAFTLTGGGIMHLVDSLGRSGMEYVCCHHEQAAAIAAQAFGMYQEQLSVCLVTTGPGGTNALTGLAAAYVDSTPVIFLSGQVKRSDFASLRGVRQFGAQENDIVSMAKPVAKYAVTVQEPDDIAYELEKAVYLATSGRKGPVWLDIPLDVQAAEIDVETLHHFTIPKDAKLSCQAEVMEKVLEKLGTSKRPVILVGQGMVSAGAADLVRDFVKKYHIPVMSTWRALDFLDSVDEDFFGSPGLQAPRYSNLILQHADCLFVLGSRLDNMITAFDEEHFAFRAQKVIVDIDEKEIEKLNMPNVLPVVADIKEFMECLHSLEERYMQKVQYNVWHKHCNLIKKRFSIYAEKQNQTGVDLYKVTQCISECASMNDTIVISSTSRCNTAGHIAFLHKKGQKTISSMGMGSMGFALPSVVGAYYANAKKRVVMIEGDGSLQLNIQEFETIAANGIDAKMFIFDNRGYAAITTMQDRNFAGFYVGSNEKSGLYMPDTEKIVRAYGLPYLEINSEEEIRDVVNKAFAHQGPIVCNIKGSLYFDEIPKCISHIDETTGKRVSAALENPYPFLEKEELNTVTELLLSKEE